MNIDGVYKCTLDFNPEGIPLHLTHTDEMVLHEEDGQLQGRMFPTFFWLSSPFRGGTVDGNKFKFNVCFATPCQQFGMEVEGEVDEEGNVNGVAQTPTGPYQLYGKKVREYKKS